MNHPSRSPNRSAGAALLLLLIAACGGSRLTPSFEPQAAAVVLPASCTTGEDSDADGLTDECELRLVTAFAPLLMFSQTRCTPPPLLPRDEVAGGYFHAAQPVRGTIRLVYMPAYYRDCGWSGAKCLVADCAPHQGDSEVIAIDVTPVAEDRWMVERIFLSAHCFGRIRSDCRWYEGEELEAFEWLTGERSAPIVWVSDGRHANYPSHERCERGHWGIDTCDREAQPVRFPVIAARNIGSRTVPRQEPDRRAGCASGAWIEPDEPLLVGANEVECFWDDEARFRGWQGSGRGVTGYGQYLRILGL